MPYGTPGPSFVVPGARLRLLAGRSRLPLILLSLLSGEAQT